MESEAERGQTATEQKMSMDSTLLIDVSVAGELSNYMDLKFETLHGLWSSEAQNVVNEFKCCDFTSEADNYRILVREKTMDMEADQSKALEGEISSSELPESLKNHIIKLPEYLILRPGSGMLTILREEEKWRQTGVMVLRDSSFHSLPEKPDFPNLVLLLLQRNRSLREIPESFFSCMPSLRVVDLSDNKISFLPPSLFALHELQVLILRNCKFLDAVPDEIEGLVHLEVLDLSGTELKEAPDGIGHLTRMRNLQLTFHGTDDESEYSHLPPDLLSHNILSNLQSLEALGIVVHPEDVRWIRNAEAIMQDVGQLKCLFYLEFYFPRVEILKKFIETSPSWQKISFNKFKFVVGQNVKRFADRVPNDVEIKFNEQKRCLRFVNGEDAPEAVKEVLKHVTAFYLDHHQVIQSLSEFGMTTSKEIKFCVVRECPEVEAIIRDDENVEPAYPSLEHLGIYYLWKLECIAVKQPPRGSFCSLKSLTVNTCPRLEFIFYESMLQSLHNLEELVVEDCESVEEIIRECDGEANDSISTLPHKLNLIKLYYLPQLLTLWKMLEANLEDPVLKQDLEAVRVVTVYSCPELDISLLHSIASDVRVLDSDTVFQNEGSTSCSEVEDSE